jgi:hypothetical protein
MGLGDLTKQFAKQAIESQVKDVLAAPEPAADKAAQVPPESAGATIVRQLQAMQAALKENEELVVLFYNGLETLRVLDFFQASPQVIVLAGFDSEKNTTRVISPAESLQLTCKVVKTPASAKPVRIRFITPKP